MKRKYYILIPLIIVIGLLIAFLVRSFQSPSEISEIANLLWQPAFVDSIFTSPRVVTSFEEYRNRTLTQTQPEAILDDDVKFIFHTGSYARFVNNADGYAVTLPKPFTPDFRWSAIRSRFESDDFILNITLETKNPYGNTKNGWEIYQSEWLEMYLVSRPFLQANNISLTRHEVDTETMPGYTIYLYTLEINGRTNIEYRYYNIAAIRENGEYIRFFLLHYKSKVHDNERFDEILKSFRTFEPAGVAQNDQTPFIPIINENWNEETKVYYNLLCNKDTVDWGFFTNVLIDSPVEYDYRLHQLRTRQDFLQNAMEHNFQIMPTYLHVGDDRGRHAFPTRMATEVAAGNGFNNKPVLQLSYQFTVDNNDLSHGYTPVFDILNGNYDDNFRMLAQEIKSYGSPVLFRLNNEMDTDWTSYSAIRSLLCTDIFAWNWAHLYNIFEEEGVDNVIWVFETAASDAIPYSNWGHGFNYLPHDISMINVLSSISYEMGNDGDYILGNGSFINRFRQVYERNMPYFSEFPWGIGEFACGAGGDGRFVGGVWEYTERFRNREQQALWVEEMLEVFNNPNHPAYEYTRRFRFAVWFSTNDVIYYDGQQRVTNQLRLGSENQSTLEAFRLGFDDSTYEIIQRPELPVIYDYIRLRSINEWVSNSGGNSGHNNYITITESDAGLTFTLGGTNGWPNIATWSKNPLTIPNSEWSNYTLYYDFTVNNASEASIILISDGNNIRLTEYFLPQDRRWQGIDMSSGTYQGSVGLDDLLTLLNYNEDNFELAGIRLFVVGGNGASVTINEMQIK